MSGELKKMKVQAIKVGEDGQTEVLKNKAGKDLVYFALVNPETYSVKNEIIYSPNCPAPGTSGKKQQYAHTNPGNLQFDFLFDSTGVIPKPMTSVAGDLGGIPLVGAVAGAIDSIVSGKKKYDIIEEIALFKSIVLDYDGDFHRPREVELIWGTLLFQGTLSSLQFNYKLFRPDGVPIRAVATAVFIGSIDDTLRVRKENNKSADLTHIRTVNQGDTLPLMAYNIYGDSAYYLEVARINKLSNFRNLKPGDKIFFPPIDKINNGR